MYAPFADVPTYLCAIVTVCLQANAKIAECHRQSNQVVGRPKMQESIKSNKKKKEVFYLFAKAEKEKEERMECIFIKAGTVETTQRAKGAFRRLVLINPRAIDRDFGFGSRETSNANAFE